jgi:hypothetical protein
MSQEASVGVTLVRAPPAIASMCTEATAEVGYPAPCPTRFPRGFAATPSLMGCHLRVIGASRPCRGSTVWAGWIVGSSQDGLIPPHHLVIVASPHPVRNLARLVNGPAWIVGEHEQVLGHETINGWNVTSLFVPPAANDGGAFAGHVVLAWTTGGHSYAVGFHDIDGEAATLALDNALVRSIRLR